MCEAQSGALFDPKEPSSGKRLSRTDKNRYYDLSAWHPFCTPPHSFLAMSRKNERGWDQAQGS